MRGEVRSVLGPLLGGLLCCLTLTGCVVVVGNETRVQHAESGRTPRWRLGVTLDEVDRATASQLGLDRERVSLIARVVDGSPAERAGLQRYDIITRVGSSDSASVSEVLDAICCARSGEEFRVTVLRGGQPVEVTATLRD